MISDCIYIIQLYSYLDCKNMYDTMTWQDDMTDWHDTMTWQYDMTNRHEYVKCFYEISVLMNEWLI